MMKNYYQDPEKQRKLEEAIALGFINRALAADGVYHYELTPTGLARWQFEKVFNNK